MQNPVEEATQAPHYIPNWPLTSVMGCINSSLPHSLARSLARSCSEEWGVCLARCVRRIYEEGLRLKPEPHREGVTSRPLT